MQSLEQMIVNADGLELAGSAPSGSRAISELPTLQPEIVLLDLNLPDMHGHDVLRKLRLARIETPILNDSTTFYISVVIFIWWLIITPLTFYDLFYGSVDLSKPFRHPEFFGDINYITLRKRIYLFSNIFMYLTFIFALIWCRPEKD